MRTDRGVTVATADGRIRVDLIEHLLAAVGGLGVSGDLLVEAGDEIPCSTEEQSASSRRSNT